MVNPARCDSSAEPESCVVVGRSAVAFASQFMGRGRESAVRDDTEEEPNEQVNESELELDRSIDK